jgi:hypothetical protein
LLKPIAERHGYRCVDGVVNSSACAPQNRNRFYAVTIAGEFVPSNFGMGSLMPRGPRVCRALDSRGWLAGAFLVWVSLSQANFKFKHSSVWNRNPQYVMTLGKAKVERYKAGPAYITADMRTPPQRPSCTLDHAACVTDTRGESGRLWIFVAPDGNSFTKCAQLSVDAIGSFQCWKSFRIAALDASVSSKALCGAVGNSCSHDNW